MAQRGVRGAALMLVGLLAACAAPEPAPQFPELTFAHLQPLPLAVDYVQVASTYEPPFRPPNVEHLMPLPPEAALRAWAADRLQAAGGRGQYAVFTITEAGVTEQELSVERGLSGMFTTQPSQRYQGQLAGQLEIFGSDGGRLGIARASVQRTDEALENFSLNDRERLWFRFSEAMVNELAETLAATVRRDLGQFVGARPEN